MASSLLNLAYNLAEVIHEINCKYGHDTKKKKNVKRVELNTKNVNVALNMQTLRMIQ